MKCCEKVCDTPFCPFCGRKVREPHPLSGLLEHCEKTRASLEKRDLRCPKKSRARSVQKWTNWTQQLREIVNAPVDLEGQL